MPLHAQLRNIIRNFEAASVVLYLKNYPLSRVSENDSDMLRLRMARGVVYSLLSHSEESQSYLVWKLRYILQVCRYLYAELAALALCKLSQSLSYA